ncbi:MAG: serine/threonine-protein kinase [Proteobacteria bacterium]|nr:serine/threonine-protein kinase [Pseudomonadota bacterium]
MSADLDRRAMELFEQALELDGDARERWLDASCEDPKLRRRVETMLRADSDADASGLLDRDADDHLSRLSSGSRSRTPGRIGPYKVVERLGQGGMATVYRGDRASGDFDQTVALKVIRPSRRAEHWEARFLTERQILASLKHPNIAQLLDGGLTDDGDPYFAMEFVNGEPITEYCDNNRLDVRSRIVILLSVCDAVSYAHRKLVVHRDLKPNNILVDDNERTKLLDFGIAKLLTDEDTSRTKTTLRALTPDYAAPEQFAGGDVTTAVDVYALGGLLYELLSGRRPFADAGSSALDIERNIRERGAPTFARLGAAIPDQERDAIAGNRDVGWRRLQRTIRGDLENIALKALRAEPERRYASVEGFAADLRRYLDGLPVHARADTVRYRMTKFAGRHSVGLPLSIVAVLGLVFSTGVAIRHAGEARIEAARANETRDFVTSLFEFAAPDKSLGDRLTARQLLDLGAQRVDEELAGQPQLRAEMLLLLATTYGQLGLYDTALPLAERASAFYESTDDSASYVDALTAQARLRRLNGEFAAADRLLDEAESLIAAADAAGRSALLIERGENFREQAQFDAAAAAFEEALAIDRQRDAPAPEIARDLYRLGTLRFSAGDSEQALDLLRDASARLAEAGATHTTRYASIQHDVGVMLIQRGELDAARTVLEEVRDARTTLLGDAHPDLATTLKELAGIARQQNASEDAERLYLAALDINEAMLGPSHPETANNLNSLAVFYRGLGDNERALEFGLRALDGATGAYGGSHPTVGLMTVNVGSMQRMLGDLDAAIASVEKGLGILVGALGEEHHLAGVAYNALAGVQHDIGDDAPAEANYRRALGIFEATAGANHPHTISIINGLATLLLARGELDEAEALFERAAETATAVLPENHPSTAIVQLGLARTIALRGDCARAGNLADRYGRVLEAAGQSDRPDVTETRRAIAGCR